ncbi:YckD family protein [Caldalkalibacillus salinus]|uniref:YckD family protein n=1 Tax=Caldalkalibacillus salinus TaxID=2803787 RepID=UPI0019249379|nr:YckD family protein [Caldalkalibacillus salinus]
MKKLGITLMTVTMLTTLLVGAAVVNSDIAFASPSETGEEAQPTVQLTKEQQNEISALTREIMDKKKEVISKYVDYGVLSEEKGQQIIDHMDEHYSKLEQNGFVPPFDKYKKHHHKHRE